MVKAILLSLLLVAASAAPDSGWSWGADDSKTPAAKPVEAPEPAKPASEQSRAGRAQFEAPHQQSLFSEVSNEDFHEPLPLEPHSAPLAQEQQQQQQQQQHPTLVIVDPESAASTEEGGREGRFLGLSDTLCDWGVGSGCNKKIKKKKGNGYPHTAVNTHYGPPPQNHYNYQTAHQSTAYDYNSYNTHDVKPKGHKKKSGGVSDLLSGFLNSYTKPKKNKGKGKGYNPSSLPTYIPPSQPHDGYGAPIYVAEPVKAYIAKPHYPKPSYPAPKPAYSVPKPDYSAPKPNYHAPKPTYNAPKPTYGAPKPTYGAPKPTYNIPKDTYAASKHDTVHSHHKAVHHKGSVVQSSYSTGAASHQKPHFVPGPVKPAAVYTQTVGPVGATKVQHLHSHTHVYHGSQVIKPGQTGHAGSSNGFHHKSDNAAKTFVGQESSSSFVTNPVNAEGHSITNNANRFDANQNSGFSSHSQFASNTNGGFNANRFQPPAHKEHGFAPSSTTIEQLMSLNQVQSHFGRTIYSTDCHCVSEQFCKPHNIVTGQRDLSNVIDARHQKNTIFSNATSEEVPIVSNATETSRSGRSFDFDSLATEAVTEAATESSDADETTDAPSDARRKRRDAETTEQPENFSDVQGRQLTGYTPGPEGCRRGTVCCKRPVYSPARSLPVCGKANEENILGRIKTQDTDNGRAGFGEYPWQAAILKKSAGEMVYVCGATLVSDAYLITAAHCVNDIDVDMLSIRLGEWDVRDKTEFYPHIESKVSGLYIHPEFYEGNLENDIAIIRLAKRLDFTKYPHISPVCLPPAGADFSSQLCTITGWGKDGWGSEGEFQAILKETQVPVMPKGVCQDILRTTKLGTAYSLSKGMMCAGGEEGKDACKGDGGGPLVCRGSSKEYILAGVVSWGLGCGERGVPGVYVDVPHYIDWINSITS